MRRDQLEHLIRACADIAGDDDIVIVGSQAILGRHSDAPPSLLGSVDDDAYPRSHPERLPLVPLDDELRARVARGLEGRIARAQA